MTRKQAIEYDNELKEQLKKYSNDCGLDGTVGEYIVDHFVEFTPEDSIKGRICEL